MTWEDARMYCWRMNATLAVLTDREEQLFVNKTLLNDENIDEVWLGASTGSGESQWKWEDGSQLTVQSYSWIYHDLDMQQWFKGVYCLAIFGSRFMEGAGKLFYETCHEKIPFICQREEHIPPTTLATSATTTTYMSTSLDNITSSDDQETKVSTIVLAVMLGIFVVLSFVFFVLYIRQRNKSRPQTGLYEQTMPHMDGIEHPTYSCLDDRNLSPSNIYERITSTSTDNAIKAPQERDKGSHVWNNSAYIDVRTANNFQMWTVE